MCWLMQNLYRTGIGLLLLGSQNMDQSLIQPKMEERWAAPKAIQAEAAGRNQV